MEPMDAILSPRRRLLLAALGACALAPACGERAGASARADLLHLRGATMGSTYNVRIAGGSIPGGVPADIAAAARQGVSAAFDNVVARMSTYDPASELRRFNRHGADTPFALSADMLEVLVAAQQVNAVSDGAFDITVGPLVDAWGFGAGSTGRGLPVPAATGTLPVGGKLLHLDAQAGTLRKARSGVQIDLSGIAKGYGVDRAAQALDALGLEHYMVEAGGEIRTRGLNAQGRPWQIAVERPDAWPQQVHRVLPLQGLAMATSGDYRNFYEVGGRRYCHEIDPATREPILGALASVSVVADNCMFADAMATALMVQGPERGLALASRLGLAALFIVREPGERLRDIATPAFATLAGMAPA